MTLLNRKSWVKSKLGDVAREYSKRVENPSQSGYEKFVGSDNIGRFDFNINNWQSTADVISAMKIFSIGDYLLVRRSLYASDFRERAPRATFEGVCSGDILTIQEIESKVANGFLYCVLNSKPLWEFIVANGSGSITRRIKWPELASFEFPLPPLDEQIKITELLKSIELGIDCLVKQENNLIKIKNQSLRMILGGKKKFGNFLKPDDFHKVAFEKIAHNISERVEPKQTNLDIYVGLEHLDSDDLVIRRRGKPEDVIGTKLRIYQGDIIFGKRRAYLRKVAVSDFDGIVSAHSMVLRADEKNIEKDFLPFFMQSDEFINRAVKISEGSLSPTIKWKTLAQQEFEIPKKEKQFKFVEVFKNLDDARELVRQQKEALTKLKLKILNELFG